MPAPNEAMMNMIARVKSRLEFAGFPINNEPMDYRPASECESEHARITIGFFQLPTASITLTFTPPSDFSPLPECAVSYYGPRGNFSCMAFTDNIDCVLINYGRAIESYWADVARGQNDGSI